MVHDPTALLPVLLTLGDGLPSKIIPRISRALAVRPYERPGSASASDDPAYFWSPTGSFTFTVTVSIGRLVAASTSFQREFSAVPWTVQQESLPADGFIGEFVHPAGGSARRPALLVLGGSGGGPPSILLDGLLASQGYIALGVAYFGLPGPAVHAGQHPVGVLRPCAALAGGAAGGQPGQDRGPRCLPGQRGRATARGVLPEPSARGHRFSPERRLDLLLPRLHRPRLDAFPSGPDELAL